MDDKSNGAKRLESFSIFSVQQHVSLEGLHGEE